MDTTKWNSVFFVENATDCLNYIRENYHTVPYLNINNAQEMPRNSLVRFRGMVQDMFDPEYYLEKCEVTNTISNEKSSRTGMYSDTLTCKDGEVLNVDSENNISSERHTFVIITTPGLNDWVNKIEEIQYKLEVSNNQTSNVCKRRLDDIEDVDMAMETSTNENKKVCNGNRVETTESLLSKEHFLNFPIPSESGKACHVKIYENNHNIKLNEVYDFVGFLATDFIPLSSENESNFDTDMEVQTHNPPSSLVPRIHCISWNKIEYLNPLANNATISAERLKFLRKELHLVLTEVLMGDELAASYLLYHMMSKVYLRRDLMPLGSFTLNISNIPVSTVEDYGIKLYQLMQMLIPKSYYLPMTLGNMNELTFIPKKDYSCNRLTSGLLQLSDGTQLVLDETKLAPGKLTDTGLKAVAALNAVIKNQEVSYNFSYYNMHFDCDIPILVLSEGKSLLPSDYHVVLNPSEIHVNTYSEIYDAVLKLLNPELLNDIRVYLSIARNQQYDITEDMMSVVQNDFVNFRQTHNINADDLHQLLVLSRLVCIADGKHTLDEECWNTACQLENSRKARLA